MSIEDEMIEALGSRTLAHVALRTLGIPAATLASLRAGTHIAAPRKLLTEAHACMRATGWQLAPAGETDEDGVLQLAVAEVEAQFGELLAAAPEAARDGR